MNRISINIDTDTHSPKIVLSLQYVLFINVLPRDKDKSTVLFHLSISIKKT